MLKTLLKGKLVRAASAVGLTALVFGGLFVGTASAATVVTGTLDITGGSLAFINSTPANFTKSLTLNGADQTVNVVEPFDVSDATGSGDGWNIQLASSAFANGTGTPAACSSAAPCYLPTTATVVSSTPTVSCDSGSTCTVASNSISYPYTMPAADGSVATTATKMYDAAVNTGMGNMTVTPTMVITVPGNAYSGTYTATIDASLVSGP